jgi:hypothetical protein
LIASQNNATQNRDALNCDTTMQRKTMQHKIMAHQTTAQIEIGIKKISIMKNEFQNLGISLREIALLLFVPDSTVRAWFNRETAIPSKYYGYISGLKIYQVKHEEEDLQTVYTQWETDNRALLETQKTKTLRELRVFELKNNLALDKLKLKQTRLLKRLHLAENYPNYLREDLQNTENLVSWCSLLSRRSAFDLGDISLAIQKLEEKKAALTAQIQYWEGVLR